MQTFRSKRTVSHTNGRREWAKQYLIIYQNGVLGSMGNVEPVAGWTRCTKFSRRQFQIHLLEINMLCLDKTWFLVILLTVPISPLIKNKLPRNWNNEIAVLPVRMKTKQQQIPFEKCLRFNVLFASKMSALHFNIIPKLLMLLIANIQVASSCRKISDDTKQVQMQRTGPGFYLTGWTIWVFPTARHDTCLT